LTTQNFEFIPNILFDILDNHKNKKILEIIEIYGGENQDYIINYFDALQKKELGFYTDEIVNYEATNFDYFDPFIITNSIIDRDENSDYDIMNVLRQLDALNCQNIEIRFFCEIKIDDLSEYLVSILDSRIRSITINLKYNTDLIDIEKVKLFIDKNKRIKKIIIHSCLFEEKAYKYLKNNTIILYSNQEIYSEKCCGNISTDYFNKNIIAFIESKNVNNCLNKKISIDKFGSIKNCPSMKNSFGNIREITLLEVLLKEKFKELWSITKDQILVCKDCEFRYICHDCRAYTQNEEKYSKPLKCKYNPYEATWEV